MRFLKVYQTTRRHYQNVSRPNGQDKRWSHTYQKAASSTSPHFNAIHFNAITYIYISWSKTKQNKKQKKKNTNRENENTATLAL